MSNVQGVLSLVDVALTLCGVCCVPKRTRAELKLLWSLTLYVASSGSYPKRATEFVAECDAADLVIIQKWRNMKTRTFVATYLDAYIRLSDKQPDVSREYVSLHFEVKSRLASNTLTVIHSAIARTT
jgi:hypothetical protein